MKKIILAPSILSADKSNIISEIKKAEDAGAAFLHIDVMDGVFVPNVSLSPAFVKQIHDKHHMVNDVHIMVEKPWIEGPIYSKAGADIVTFHLEACPDEASVRKTIALIKEAGSKVGLSIKPKTQAKELLPYLNDVDLLLVMSVEPGWGGQSFMPSSLEKISFLRKAIDEMDKKDKPLIEVDGGINGETGKLVVEAGADVLVAGSYLYGHDDFAARAKGLLAL